jgi:RNA polymerase sigma-70 factor (ECF subfamily)
MTEQDSFADFVRRIRAGDEQAAAELVRRYEPAIRREVRVRMHDPRLFRLFDSMDVCQSVLASFFVRAAAGQYDLKEPGQLLKLLVAMARNKLAIQARKHYSQRRGGRQDTGDTPEGLEAVAAGPSPSQVVAGRELLNEVRRRLTEEENQLAELRAQGCGWNEIASQVGGTPQARRMQLSRAVDRVARQLGIDEE